MIELRSGEAQVAVDPRGAELRRWSVGDCDLLWTPDARVWDAVAPILFPVVGWTRNGTVRVGGKTYPLGLHGFARNRIFTVDACDDSSVQLTDRADDATLALFPFRYRLSLTFSMADTRLSCVAEVMNEGDGAMPYAFGFHPGFHWPVGREARLVFADVEKPSVPVIDRAGLFCMTRRAVSLNDRTLALTRDLMAQEALCFLETRSRAFTYEADGFGSLRITHDDLPHLALWSRPPAPFLCIESWTGHGDPEDFAGELRDKPSMRMLAPGAIGRHAATYAFTAPR